MVLVYMRCFLLLLIFNFCNSSDDKTPCQGCKELVEGIFQGFDTTARKNFGGGDVDWEEKRNLKYKTSELRLVEIIESACSKNSFQCHKILEEYEENIEHWYFKLQDDTSTTLHEYLCISTAKVCCPNDTYGKSCKDCPRGNSSEICYGHGTCKGAGDKQGSGECECSSGYTGNLCNECDAKFYTSFSNSTSVTCSSCHTSCFKCNGPGPNDCESCTSGYKEERSGEDENVLKCVDLNECEISSDICPPGKYCANTVGSHSCFDCHSVCQTCKGGSDNDCTSCRIGYKKATEEPDDGDAFQCVDVNECVEQADVCPKPQLCANTVGSYSCEELKTEENQDGKVDESETNEEKDEL